MLQTDQQETHCLAVLVDNEAGVLARVIGLFSGRGYNIESLTVAEVDHEGRTSRITVVTTGTPTAESPQTISIYSIRLGAISAARSPGKRPRSARAALPTRFMRSTSWA